MSDPFSPSRRGVFTSLAALSAATLPAATAASATPKRKAPSAPLLAPTPPMGWNSWNSFGTTINETQSIENARIMAEKLLPSGYNIFTVDIQWYEPEARGYDYNKNPKPVLDGHGRLLPAPNRFASSVNGAGFKPLAGAIHALGLKFGIHLMRGIPRLAVQQNLPVLGTAVRAQDIADTTSICPWNPDMYGVDMSKPGAQAYYDSVFALYASWGVDFIKMDDMSRPYDAHAPEIEAAHKAIVKTGRPMALSLSPGETPVARGDHVKKYAQMWRISDDFWDDWAMLKAQFVRLENWNVHCGAGGWPDADMLPLGQLALGDRETRFTPDEQRTVMTLWSIARSPLIMGGDLRKMNQATLDLLTNPEVLAVNQEGSANRPHFLQDNLHVWTSNAKGGRGIYLALFNSGDRDLTAAVNLGALGLKGKYSLRDLWRRQDMGSAQGVLSQAIPRHGAYLFKLSV